jgi:hypothetical protein
MAETDLVCSKCVGRRRVNNIMMKVNSKVMVTTVPPSRPLAYTRRPIFVSASVHRQGPRTSNLSACNSSLRAGYLISVVREIQFLSL